MPTKLAKNGVWGLIFTVLGHCRPLPLALSLQGGTQTTNMTAAHLMQSKVQGERGRKVVTKHSFELHVAGFPAFLTLATHVHALTLQLTDASKQSASKDIEIARGEEAEARRIRRGKLFLSERVEEVVRGHDHLRVKPSAPSH